jgi:methionyl-tRNA formyltransferase
MPSQPKILFFGTAEIAVPSLRQLHEAGFSLLVVTQPDKPVGRHQELTPSPVKVEAQRLGLSILQPKSLKTDIAVKEQFAEFAPDAAVVVAYGKLLPKDVLDLPKHGLLNLHPSMLPKYRGPSPIQSAIMNGETETGITIMLLDEGQDSGPILYQEKVEIKPDETATELLDRAGAFGAPILVDTLQKYLVGDLTPRPQDHDQATFTTLIEREHGQVDWTQSAEVIIRKFRAFQPWPGLYTFWHDKRLKMAKMSLIGAGFEGKQPGLVQVDPEGYPVVVCGVGAVCLSELQLEGKAPSDGATFVRGYVDFVGSTLA